MMNSRTTHWQFVLWECFEQAKGFSLFMLKAILNGRGDEVVELAKTNLFR